MTNTIDSIEECFYNIIDLVAKTGGEYDKACELIGGLCELLEEECEEVDWHIGEGQEFCLDDLVVGAYWHFTEWHEGQNSASYQLLGQLSRVFDPGMSCCEEYNLAYQLLNQLAGDNS